MGKRPASDAGLEPDCDAIAQEGPDSSVQSALQAPGGKDERPAGPSTVEDALSWPWDFAKQMHAADYSQSLMETLKENWRQGIEFSTEYSGCGQAESAI
eukprot:6971879-Lingulodinium_polyedra.AAC.1